LYAVFSICAVLAGCVFGQNSDKGSSLPVLTVCEALQHRGELNGKSVIVIGRLASTEEGSWLGEDGDAKIVTDGYTWQNLISLSYRRTIDIGPPQLPTDFDWNQHPLLAKLEQVRRTTKLYVDQDGHYTSKWFAVFGRFETAFPLRVGWNGKELMGAGFGHLGGAPAQLIAEDKSGYHELKPE
jgi:hypothetical protein